MNKFKEFTDPLKHEKLRGLSKGPKRSDTTFFHDLCGRSKDLMTYKSHTTGQTMFDEYVREGHLFLFSPRKEEVNWDQAWTDQEEEPLDLPFPVTAIEVAGGWITSPAPGDKIQVHIGLIIAQESAPKEYNFLHYSSVNGQMVVSCVMKKTEPEEWASFNGLLKEFLKRLAQEKTGVESRPNKIKIGSGKSKEFWRPKPITHVTPVKYISEVKAVGGGVVDWTHRWEVRGHWRSVSGIGKDRDGNYNQSGWTWVKNHVKGPEKAPLIKKTYIVKEGQNEGT